MPDQKFTPEEIAYYQAKANDPEFRRQARLARIEKCRQMIRKGDEESLWDYVSKQWPSAVFDDFQRDIIASGMLGGIKGIAIKGCTSPGKGFAVATLANCWFDIFTESKVVITSSNIEHAERVMFGEIVAVRQAMKHPGPGKVMSTQFQDTPKHYLVVANPKTGEGFSGQHGAKTLFVMDESSGVPDELFDNARQQASLIVALSNPRTLSGWFRDLFKSAADPDLTQTVLTRKGPWRLVTVGGADCRNVREKRLKEPYGPLGGIEIDGHSFGQGERIPEELFERIKTIIPNQMDYARYVETMASPDEFVRRVFGEGKFPVEDADSQLFLQSWFERHHQFWEQSEADGSPIDVEAFGLDIAASVEGDETILTAGGRTGIRKQHAWKKSDTMQTVGQMLEIAEHTYGLDLKDGRTPVAVDANGIGKSVCDTLDEIGVQVIRVFGNGAPERDRDRYHNRRAELYGELARRLSPDESVDPFAIPRDTKLVQELCSHNKIQLARGFKLTPKDRYPGQKVEGHTIREHLGRSPDRSDSACLLYTAALRLNEDPIPTLNRPLLLVTQEEEYELRAPKENETPEETDRRIRREESEEIDRVLGYVKTTEEEGAIPFPDFL